MGWETYEAKVTPPAGSRGLEVWLPLPREDDQRVLETGQPELAEQRSRATARLGRPGLHGGEGRHHQEGGCNGHAGEVDGDLLPGATVSVIYVPPPFAADAIDAADWAAWMKAEDAAIADGLVSSGRVITAAALLALSGTYEELYSLFVFAAWIFFAILLQSFITGAYRSSRTIFVSASAGNSGPGTGSVGSPSTTSAAISFGQENSRCSGFGGSTSSTRPWPCPRSR